MQPAPGVERVPLDAQALHRDGARQGRGEGPGPRERALAGSSEARGSELRTENSGGVPSDHPAGLQEQTRGYSERSRTTTSHCSPVVS